MAYGRPRAYPGLVPGRAEADAAVAGLLTEIAGRERKIAQLVALLARGTAIVPERRKRSRTTSIRKGD